MALRLFGLAIKKQHRIIKGIQVGNVASLNTINKAGNRDYVGYGLNGGSIYFDNVGFPFPAIRFREETPDITELRDREKGDWSELSLEEKKCLYRHSFCQTFAEIKAPTGYWKMSTGVTLILISIAIFMNMVTNLVLYPELPFSYSLQCEKAQLKRILAMEVNPITGISSKWDYVNKKWK